MRAKRSSTPHPGPLPIGERETSAKRLAGEGGPSREAHRNAFRIRAADAGDDAFMLSLVERFVAFELPKWRKKSDCASGIRRDLTRGIESAPPGETLFVAENAGGERVGFLRLQKTRDF